MLEGEQAEVNTSNVRATDWQPGTVSERDHDVCLVAHVGFLRHPMRSAGIHRRGRGSLESG